LNFRPGDVSGFRMQETISREDGAKTLFACHAAASAQYATYREGKSYLSVA